MATRTEEAIAPRWPEPAPARVPFWVYTDPAVYAREMRRIFEGPTWNYVGLACEIPNAGDFKRNWIGETSVIAVRGADGAVNVLRNSCRHRGAQVCRELLGNRTALICPYHQWTYGFDGRLTGVPFRRGVKGQGGMPDDFDPAAHGLDRLNVSIVNGVIFASFDAAAPSFADYLGPENLRYFTRIFDGRPLRVLGYQRQMIRGNWKLMMENIKDPYHAGLLHLFLVTFGLFRVDQKSACVMDDTRGHAVMVSRRARPDDHAGTEDVAKFQPDYVLADPSLIAPRKEFADDVTLAMQTLFPNLIIQAQSNTLAMRHVIPRGTGQFELAWTFFGYADDDAELATLRLRQANLMGAAGYVSVDDTEMMDCSHAGILSAAPDGAAVFELGGRDTEPTDHLVTENAIRGFYQHYRRVMGLG